MKMANLKLVDRITARVAFAAARRQYQRFLHAAHRAAATQERVLLTKIRRNANSLFGREHGFDKIHSYREFAERVPIQTYEQIKPYVQRVMAGETDALFGPGQDVLMFAMTSGSTDRPKYIPVTQPFLQEYRHGWTLFGVKMFIDHPDTLLRPLLQVASPIDEQQTPLGVPCGSISGLFSATQRRLVRKYYVTPPLTAGIRDAESRYYTIMRFGIPRPVAWMITASPATQLKLARTAGTHADRLIRDIHDGTLTPPGGLAESVRAGLTRRLRPDTETAKRLEGLLDDYGELLPRHIWDLFFLCNWTGGTLGLHLAEFPHYFGHTPVRDIGLLATEGRVSICTEDGTPTGVLDVVGSFFEFVESGARSDDPTAIRRCHEVEPGRDYRIVMTTSAGFYRYDIGDFVRVHRLEGQAPVIEFLHRGSNTCSVTGEKLTEWQATAAFSRTCESLGLPLSNFVLAPVWSDPPYYRLHIDEPIDDTERFARAYDEALARINMEYGAKRKSQRLGEVVINGLPSGALSRLDMHRQAQRVACHEQYKHRFLYSEPGDDDELLTTRAAV